MSDKKNENKSKSKDENNKNKKTKKLDSKLQELEQHIEDLTNDLKRAHADFANYKRRMETERLDSVAFGQKGVVMALLPTIDNIERALGHLPEDLKEHEWAKGVEKIATSLLKDLEKIGIEPLGEKEESFNPELHEAVAVEGDGDNENVSEILQRGYQLNGSVIRPAIVKVKKQ